MTGGMKGVPQLERRLQAVAQVAKNARPILQAWQTRTVAYAKVYAPKRSGHLKQTIHAGSLNEHMAQVEVSAVYAAAHEFGSGLYGPNHAMYVIKPVKGKWLAWGGARRLTGTLRSGEKPDTFARIVHHPGIKPHPFLVPAAQKAQEEVGVAGIVTAWNNAA